MTIVTCTELARRIRGSARLWLFGVGFALATSGCTAENTGAAAAIADATVGETAAVAEVAAEVAQAETAVATAVADVAGSETTDAATDGPADTLADSAADGAEFDAKLTKDSAADAAADVTVDAGPPPIKPYPIWPLQVLTGAPALAIPQKTTTVATDDAVTAVGAVGTAVWAGGVNGTVVVQPQPIEPVNVVVLPNQVTATGAVKLMTQSPVGLWLYAENGLFLGKQAMLVPLSASKPLATVDVVAMAAGTTSSEAWVAAKQGLYRLNATQFSKVNLPAPWNGPVAAVAAAQDQVWAAVGNNVVTFAQEGGQLAIAATETGAVNGAASCPGLVGFATAKGLLVIRNGTTAHNFTLAPSGAAPLPVRAIASSGNRLWAATATTVVSVDIGSSIPVIKGLALPTFPPPDAIAIDAWGHVWLGGGQAVLGLLVGQPLSFAQDIAPIFQMRCAYCHQQGTVGPKHAFTELATVLALQDALLLRVNLGQAPGGAPGQMPPPAAPALTAVEYALLLAWVASGQNP